MKLRPLFEKTRDLLVSLFRWLARSTSRAFSLARTRLPQLARSRVVRGVLKPLKMVTRDAAIAAALVLLLLGISGLCFQKVRPGTVAVRQVNWGSDSGIERADYAPGLYFGPRFLETWYRLETRTHTVSFAWESEAGTSPILELRTREGNSAQAAVSVPYRIREGEAHGILEQGTKGSWQKGVESTVEKVLLEELAQLTSDEFSDTDRRLAVCRDALIVLNAQLASHHAEADGIFITGVYFPPTYEKKQQQMQLGRQTLKTDQVLAQLKAQKLDNEFTVQELDRQVQELVAELDRQFQAEQVRMVERVIENQKLDNQFLAQQLEEEKAELIDRLGREFQQAKVEEHDRRLEEAKLQNRAIELTLAQEQLGLTTRLDREFEEERAERIEVQLERQKIENQLAAQALLGAEQALTAELDRAIEAERIAHRQESGRLQRQALADQTRRRHEADLEHERLVAEGALALEKAETLRDELHTAALATPGGRLYLAKEAATKLNFGKVTLNSNDPRVPSVLDLDRMVALLIGGEGEK